MPTIAQLVRKGRSAVKKKTKSPALRVSFNSMTNPLKHYHYDIFELVMERLDMRMKISFFTNVKGDIDRLSAPLEPTVKDIVFQRLPAKGLTDKSFLEQFVGEYEVIGMTMTIALKGEKALVVSLPLQPVPPRQRGPGLAHCTEPTQAPP